MQELAVITIASHLDRGAFDMLESARKFGYVPFVIGLNGKPLDGHHEKGRLIRDVLPGILKRYAVTMFVDAFDVLFVDRPERVLEEFYKFHAPIVFTAERYCYPEEQSRIDSHPESHTPYRFLNSGGFVGYTDHLIQAFEAMRVDGWGPNVSDQAHVMDFYFHNKHIIRLDTECRIFQSLVYAENDVEYGRHVRNAVTGSYPKVIHGNGGWDMAAARKWVENA